MDVSVSKTGTNTYVVALGEKRAVLSLKDLKKLLRQLVEILLPDVIKLAPRPEDLPIRLKHVTMPSVQAFLKSADRGELIVFLKATEKDEPLQKKLQAAMDPAMRKATVDELSKMAKVEQPPAAVERAFKHLSLMLNDLEAKGIIVYEDG
ncbi:MAG: hypothetical protein FJX42_05055 [Alphaproteobacteria bacterium]|nr:hypothetical protein [Alphaproteobacteria bacterium]